MIDKILKIILASLLIISLIPIGPIGKSTVIASIMIPKNQISSGDSHTLALKPEGTVWSWGDNWYGQLGDNSTTQRSTPVQVSGLSGVIEVAAGGNFSLALKSDGTVWAWGSNGS